MSVGDLVRVKVSPRCLTRKCNDDGCTVSLNGISQSSFAIDINHSSVPADRSKPHCDFLFFGSRIDDKAEWVIPIELKRGEARASEVQRQLQAGANLAEYYIPSDEQIRFTAVVASGKVHKIERARLASRAFSIRFRERSVFIGLAKCGDRLATMMKSQ